MSYKQFVDVHKIKSERLKEVCFERMREQVGCNGCLITLSIEELPFILTNDEYEEEYDNEIENYYNKNYDINILRNIDKNNETLQEFCKYLEDIGDNDSFYIYVWW